MRTTGQLRVGALGLRLREGHVHVLERDVEIVGHHRRDGRHDPLADVHPGDLEVHPVVGLDLDQQVIEEGPVVLDEDVGEVLVFLEFGRTRDGGVGGMQVEAARNDQRWTCDQESLEQATATNYLIGKRH